MPDFSINKIILHRFHVDNNEGESGIGYAIIIVHNLMIQLVLTVKFKHQFLHWYSFAVPMKATGSMIGKIYNRSRDAGGVYTDYTANVHRGS